MAHTHMHTHTGTGTFCLLLLHVPLLCPLESLPIEATIGSFVGNVQRNTCTFLGNLYQPQRYNQEKGTVEPSRSCMQMQVNRMFHLYLLHTIMHTYNNYYYYDPSSLLNRLLGISNTKINSCREPI